MAMLNNQRVQYLKIADEKPESSEDNHQLKKMGPGASTWCSSGSLLSPRHHTWALHKDDNYNVGILSKIYVYSRTQIKKKTLNMVRFFWIQFVGSPFAGSTLQLPVLVAPPFAQTGELFPLCLGCWSLTFKPSLQQKNMFKKQMAKSCKNPHPKSIHWHQ